MLQVLKMCFGKRKTLNLVEFKQVIENLSSDMALSVLSLLRERLPCSENYWRYRRNFELTMDINMDKIRSPKYQPKQIGQAHMSFVKNLVQYNFGESQFKPEEIIAT